MPPMANVPSTLKLNMHWSVDADTTAQTVHYLSYSGGPPTAAQCAAMASNFVSEAASALTTLCGTHITCSGSEVTDLTSPSAGQGSGGTPWTGTRTGGQIAPGSAALINHTIARRYRGGKPRSYMPFGTSTDIDTTGLWLSASSTAFVTGFNNWVAQMLSGGVGCTITHLVNVSFYDGTHVVISPTTGRARNVPIPRASPLVDPVLSNNCPVRIGSQRRRNRKA